MTTTTSSAYTTALRICEKVNGVLAGSSALYHYLGDRNPTGWMFTDMDIFCLGLPGKLTNCYNRLETLTAMALEIVGPEAQVERQSVACNRITTHDGTFDIVVTSFQSAKALMNAFDLDINAVAIRSNGTIEFGNQFNLQAALGKEPCKLNFNASRTEAIKLERLTKYRARGYEVIEVNGPMVIFHY